MSPRWKVCQAIPSKQMTLGPSASCGLSWRFCFSPLSLPTCCLPHSCFPFSSGFHAALTATYLQWAQTEGGSGRLLWISQASRPLAMSRTVREVAKQLSGRGVMGYYGTCIQSYQHTLLSSSSPICMGVNSAAGLGIGVPATPGSLLLRKLQEYQAVCITALPG